MIYKDLHRGDKFVFKGEVILCMMLSDYYYTELYGLSRGGHMKPSDDEEEVLLIEGLD